MKHASLLHRTEYAVYRLVKGLVTALPHRATRSLGWRVGDLAAAVLRHRRRVALENVAAAFPERSAGEHRRLVRGCFRHFGAALCETVSASRFDAVSLCRRFTYEGWEHLEEAAGRPGGFFLLSAHLGYWELASYPPGLYVRPFHIVGRPLDNPLLDRKLAAGRERFGNVVIPKRGAARGMLRALKGGAIVGILIDQRVPAHQPVVEVPFFGLPARTTPTLARLSIATGAPVVPIFAFPEPRGRYRIALRPAVEPQGEGEEAVEALTRRYMALTEAEIRRRPEMWLWMHRRWR